MDTMILLIIDLSTAGTRQIFWKRGGIDSSTLLAICFNDFVTMNVELNISRIGTYHNKRNR